MYRFILKLVLQVRLLYRKEIDLSYLQLSQLFYSCFFNLLNSKKHVVIAGFFSFLVYVKRITCICPTMGVPIENTHAVDTYMYLYI